MKSKVISLFICLVFSISAVVALDLLSFKINRRKNGFIRLFPSHLALPLKIQDIKYNSYYLAGYAEGKIYLGNSSAPYMLLAADSALKDIQQVKLHISGSPPVFPGYNMLAVDSLSVYLMEGEISTIITGSLWGLNLSHIYKSPPFSFGIPLSPSTFVVRSYYNASGQNVLEKVSVPSDSIKAIYPLKKQGDGIFSTDGLLRYEPVSKSIVYIYFYRNEIVRLDSNLNVVYESHTIDTISHAYINPTYIASTKSLTLAHPPLLVNKDCSVNKDWIFVRSGLRANNEDQESFDQWSVIDVYSFKDGSYHFSFYLPDLNHIKTKNFAVYGKTLIAMYDHYLYAYRMNF